MRSRPEDLPATLAVSKPVDPPAGSWWPGKETGPNACRSFSFSLSSIVPAKGRRQTSIAGGRGTEVAKQRLQIRSTS